MTTAALTPHQITRPATEEEVRGHFYREGHDIRISRDGHVTFKRHGRGEWLEGRYVSEYRMTDVGVVLS